MHNFTPGDRVWYAGSMGRAGSNAEHQVVDERIASLTHTDRHYKALIDDPAVTLDIRPLKRKSLSIHWEMMFARSVFETPDMDQQGALLAEVAQGVDAGTLRSTFTRDFCLVNAANLKAAHAGVESGQAIGKGVLRWR